MILNYLIFACLPLCSHGIKLHEHMTKQEIELTFNCDHESVHAVEYEVTPVIHVNRFDGANQAVQISHSAIHLRAFDRNISLYLLENDNTLLGSYTPLFTAKRSRRRSLDDGFPQIVYSRMQFPIPEKLKLYHDMQNRAAVTVFTDEDNKAHVYGTIGDDFLIKPVLTRLQKEILPKYPELYQSSSSYKSLNPFSDDPVFSNVFSSGNFYEPTHHVVIKSNIQANSANYDPTEIRWKQSEQPKHDIDSGEDNLNNPFAGWHNLFQQPMAELPSQWRPAHTPHTVQPSTLNLATKEPWRPPTNQFPTEYPHTVVPNAQPTPGKQSDIPQTSGKHPKAIAEHSDIVYPELLISIDYETFVAHGEDLEELSKYMAAFWNAVDLRFREMSNPQVRLNIAGLIVPQTRDSAPYFEESRVNQKILEADRTVSDGGRYFAHEDQFPKDMYDIAFAISHLDLGLFTPNGNFNDGTTGIAMLGGACKVQTGQSAVLIRDKGGFNGITTAAHELAHSMGAPHDGNATRDIPGGPCPWSDGYLMSYERRDSRGMHWSHCSKTAMSQYLSSQEAQCMRNRPDVGESYPKILPGKVVNRDVQCSRSLGAGWFSDRDKESDCAVLHCRRPLSATRFTYTTEYRPPAEGSYCGEGAICLDAVCVEDPRIL